MVIILAVSKANDCGTDKIPIFNRENLFTDGRILVLPSATNHKVAALCDTCLAIDVQGISLSGKKSHFSEIFP
jgi:hypothetical protein